MCGLAGPGYGKVQNKKSSCKRERKSSRNAKTHCSEINDIRNNNEKDDMVSTIVMAAMIQE